jgi:hypothetical protein
MKDFMIITDNNGTFNRQENILSHPQKPTNPVQSK